MTKAVKIRFSTPHSGDLKIWVSLVIACGLPAKVAAIDFTREVRPLLVSRCGACHSERNSQGRFSIETQAAMLKGGASGPAITPGKTPASLLITRLTRDKPWHMARGNPLLSQMEIKLLSDWIDQGASGPALRSTSIVAKWIAPLAPRHPAPPNSAPNPIDAFLDIPNNQVSDAVFARRVFFDLWGLAPTPEQIVALERDTRSDKRARLIDMLLADRQRYAGHWISFWNDLLRNDEGVEYMGNRQSITPWLRRALETNLRYNEFVTQLLNPVQDSFFSRLFKSKPNDNPEGFLIGVSWRGDVSAAEQPAMQAAQNSAQVFLGVNLKCSGCHDSFISKWRLGDSYGLASFFSGQELEIVRCDRKTGKKASPQFLFPELGSVSTGLSIADRRAAVARLFTAPENGRFPRTFVNRIWKQLFGRGLVEPVDDMAAEPFNVDLLDWLASDFTDHNYDIQHLLRRIMTSRAYQLPSQIEPPPGNREYHFQGPRRRRLSAEQFVDAVASITGEWRVLESGQPGIGVYAREWQFKSTPLSRALGRPIRDQVITERLAQPTTLQAMELVNGETLSKLLQRGALRMLGMIPQGPRSLFDSGRLDRLNQAMTVDLDIRGVSRLYLFLEDAGSYDPSRVVAGWANGELSGPDGITSLSALTGKKSTMIQFQGKRPAGAIAIPLSTHVEIDLRNRNLTRFRALVGVDQGSLSFDIYPIVRFLVFSEPPDMNQLARAVGERPAPSNPPKQDLTEYLYRYAYGRSPTSSEKRIAGELLGASISPEGLEDVLWAMFMSPEFQYLR